MMKPLERGQMEVYAKYIILNEVVQVILLQKDGYGVTQGQIKHYDGRTLLVPRHQLLFDSDHEMLCELAGIIHSMKNPAKNRRFFELTRELIKKQSPLSVLKQYVRNIDDNCDEQLQINFMDVG